MTIPETDQTPHLLDCGGYLSARTSTVLPSSGTGLAKGMKARGHNVHVLACRPDNGKSFTEFGDEATVHRLDSHGVFTHEYLPHLLPLGDQERNSASSSTKCSRTSFTSKATT